jgi:hypothetical protein
MFGKYIMKKTQQKRRGGKQQKRKGSKTQKRRGGAKYSSIKYDSRLTKSKIISKPKYDQFDKINANLKQKYGDIIKNKNLEQYIIKNYTDKAGNITPGVNGLSYDPGRKHFIDGESETEIEMYKKFIAWMSDGANMDKKPVWITYVDHIHYQ